MNTFNSNTNNAEAAMKQDPDQRLNEPWPIVGSMQMPPDFRYAAVLRRGRPRHGTAGKISTYDAFYRKHPPMDCYRRAKIFAPFDALAGFSQCIASKEVLYCEKKILTEGEKEELDKKINILYGLTKNSRMARENAVRVSIRHFEKCSDPQSESYTEDGKFGQYKTTTGFVYKIDVLNRCITLFPVEIDNTTIPSSISVSDIVDIQSSIIQEEEGIA